MYTIHELSRTIHLPSEKDFENYQKDKIRIEAAGGLVFNLEGQLLLMKRRGFWDLPKGKIDPGETREECALREVSEETGLIHLKLGSFLKATYHTYPYQNKIAFKPSYWYQIECLGREEFSPQWEEDITDMKWVNQQEAEKRMIEAYPSIREMVYEFFLLKPIP